MRALTFHPPKHPGRRKLPTPYPKDRKSKERERIFHEAFMLFVTIWGKVRNFSPRIPPGLITITKPSLHTVPQHFIMTVCRKRISNSTGTNVRAFTRDSDRISNGSGKLLAGSFAIMWSRRIEWALEGLKAAPTLRGARWDCANSPDEPLLSHPHWGEERVLISEDSALQLREVESTHTHTTFAGVLHLVSYNKISLPSVSGVLAD